MKMPNFLIIGAGKSGTSSLYYYLRQHPDIYMSPVKEPNFFAYDANHRGWNGPIRHLEDSITSLSEYMKLYDSVQNEKAIGEASPSNFCARACDQVRRYVPNARLVCILRQPVDAAYSAYLHRRRDGHEPESDFLKAFRATDSRKKQGWAPMLLYRRLYSL
ncbi:MAG: sulfotransferase, partial [Acidobacteriota bacterium]